MAQSFARLGADVTQIEMQDRLLANEDPEASAMALLAQEKSGVNVLTGHSAIRAEQSGDDKHLIVKDSAGKEHAIGYDALIIAVGRKARLTGYGLEELGIDTGKTVITDAYLATLYPHIFAAGDVAGPYQFTHAASHQAWHAAVNGLFGQFKRFKVDYRIMPHTTFLDPEIARVGLNEQEAKAQHIAYDVTHYGIDDLDRAIADSEAHGFVKILTKPEATKFWA